MLSTIIAILLFILFLSLSSIHFYWALGGNRGPEVVIPTKADSTKTLSPSPFTTTIVASGLLGFGLIILVKSGIIHFPHPHWLSKYGLWLIAAIFILSAIGDFRYIGFFKKIRHTKFGQQDSRYYSPFCILIGMLTLLL